jgi:hypothetical protein
MENPLIAWAREKRHASYKAWELAELHFNAALSKQFPRHHLGDVRYDVSLHNEETLEAGRRFEEAGKISFADAQALVKLIETL